MYPLRIIVHLIVHLGGERSFLYYAPVAFTVGTDAYNLMFLFQFFQTGCDRLSAAAKLFQKAGSP